jgi:DNA-binding NarL/FixJ family response regulator
MGGVRPTVLIVDDHEVFRASARALLQAGGFDVIGEAAGGMEAIEAVSTLRPEVVVLDIGLPNLDGLAVAERLAEASDPPAVMLVSGREAATTVRVSVRHRRAGSSRRASCPGRRSPP